MKNGTLSGYVGFMHEALSDKNEVFITELLNQVIFDEKVGDGILRDNEYADDWADNFVYSLSTDKSFLKSFASNLTYDTNADIIIATILDMYQDRGLISIKKVLDRCESSTILLLKEALSDY